MREITKVLKVLSDESRLRVLNLLQVRECCVCEVMQVMDISQSKASRILSGLYDAGFLKLKKEGLWSLYSIDQQEMPDYLISLLESVRLAMAKDRVAIQDIARLKKAVRVGPGCSLH